MPESAAVRLEGKVDALLDSVFKLEAGQGRLSDQMAADKRLTDQLLGFMQQAIDRLQGDVDQQRATHVKELDAEKEAREAGDKAIRSTLSKIGFALFTALLAVIASGLAYMLFQAK